MPDLHDDVEHLRGLLLRRILIGDGPLGTLRRAAEHLAVGETVELDDRAVHVERALHARIVQALDLLQDLRQTPQAAAGDDLEVLIFQIVQRLCVGRECAPLGELKVKDCDVEPPLRGDLRVELAQRARRRVARVGHEGLSLQLTPGIDLLKDAARHIHLAPHDQARELFRQCHGDGADRAQILRHVLADTAVAARRAADEHAVAVFERDAQPVDLRLDAVFRVRERSGHALEEFLHLATVEHILQALERHRVLHRCKLRQRRAAHALRGGIGCDLLRVLALKILEPAQHVVVFIVGNLRIIQHIVAVAVRVERLAQLLHFFPIVHSVPLIRCS